MKPKGKLVTAWLFGVILALIPLLFDPVHRTTERHPPQLLSLIIHGEVLIIAVALLVDTLSAPRPLTMRGFAASY